MEDPNLQCLMLGKDSLYLKNYSCFSAVPIGKEILSICKKKVGKHWEKDYLEY